MDEQSLISSVQKGNNHAFRALINMHKDVVFSVALNLVKDYQRAEEVTQDTFLKAFKSISSFEGKSKFSSWLCRIAINTGLNKIKQQKHTTTLDDQPEIEQEVFPSGFFNLQRAEQIKQINQALAKLDPTERLVVTQFYLNEQKLSEIVENTGLSLSNVKVKLHRGRKNLRFHLSSNRVIY